jgi:hypothetical protein
MNKRKAEEYSATYNQFSEESVWFNSLGYSGSTDVLNKLHRYESALHTISEHQCNDDMGEKAYEKMLKREENIAKKVKEIADKLGFKVTFNGDPRGGAIRFILPSGRSNGWDQETWGIYW